MVKIKEKNWKPIEIDGSIFSGDIEGLVGIEECTDYALDSSKLKKKAKNKIKDDKTKRKTRKRSVKKKALDLTPSKIGSSLEVSISKDVPKFKYTNILDNVEAWNNYGIPEEILQGISEQNFIQPTEIQALTLPAAILGRRDILGAAETGSGKTLAFGIPILAGILKNKQLNFNENDGSESEEEILDDLQNFEMGCVQVNKLDSTPRKPLYALILTPTRELAIQIKNNLSVFTKYTGINIAVIVGGMAAVKQERLLSKGPEIVIGTPGRLWELIQSGNSHLSQIENIKFLAIDETDRMLERGHFQELHDILERLNMDEEKRNKRQNFVFSATLTLVHDIPRHLVNKSKIKSKKLHEMTAEQKLQKIVDLLGVTNPKIVDITKGTGTSATLTECRITCSFEEKDYYVYYFLQRHPGRTLIFCNSIGCVKRLTTLLSLLNCQPLPLHASMQQRQRLKNLERFRDNKDSILIATDVAARGLDIPQIDHVLHYQTPRTSESYVHRSGRTARASKEGITVLLIEPNELQNYFKLCKTLGKREDIPLFPIQENYLNAVKERVNLARDLDKVQLHVKKANTESGWLQKAAEEMDMIVDEFTQKFDMEEANSKKKVADLKRKQLQSLLAKPIFPKGFSGKYPLISGAFETLTTGQDNNEKAIDIMKSAIENYSKSKTKPIPLFKSRNKNNNNNKKNDGVIKLNQFKKKGNQKQPKRKYKK